MRHTMRILFALLLLMQPLSLLAHEDVDHYDRIKLSASAQTQVENDTIIATLYSQEEGSDAAQLATIVNRRIKAAVELVKQHDAIKLQTNSYSTTPVYNKNKITAWRVRQSIRLESRDMPLVSQLLGELQKTLALQDINFAVSPELKNKTDNALIAEALDRFEGRAKIITQKLRRRNYRIVDINVSTSGGHYPRRQYESTVMASSMRAPLIEGGEQTLQVSVSGQIEME